MSNGKTVVNIAGYTILLFLLNGCITQPPVPAIDPSFHTKVVILYPIIDLRENSRAKSLNLNMHGNNPLEEKPLYVGNSLFRTHLYIPQYRQIPNNLNVNSEDGIKKINANWVDALNPASEGHLFFILCLTDSTSKIDLGISSTFELKGHLYDRKTDRFIWSGVGTGKGREGLLDPVFGRDTTLDGTFIGTEGAFATALENLLSKFPRGL